MKYAGLLLIAASLTGLVASVQAGHHHCGSCNCSQGHKVCRLVPEVTKTTTFEYRLECEDFCLHGKSKCVGMQKTCGCGNCAKCEPIMQPTCDCIRTRAKLVKIPVVKEKCGWKCVVVHVCNGCRQCAAAPRPATEAELQMALQQAEQQGILLTSAEEPILVAIPDDEATANLEVAPPATLEAPLPAPVAQPTTSSNPLRAFGALFGK